MEFLDKLGVLALGSRLKRVSDLIMLDGIKIYQAANIDFDPKWFPVFKLLADQSPLGIMEISKKLDISHPYVIKLVKELEKNNLVSNVGHSKDGRKRSIQLSDEGMFLLSQIQPIWNDIYETMEALLRETENDLYKNLIQIEKSFKESSFLNRVEQTYKSRLANEVVIHNYKPEYKEYFKSLNYEWLEKYFKIEPIDVKILGNPEEYIIKKGGAVIFAESNGKFVGTCALKLKEGFGYELTKMAVTENAQGLQIGKRLGQEIINIAKEKKAQRLFLESNRILAPAINLYNKLGFVEATSPWKSDYKRSDIYMEYKF